MLTALDPNRVYRYSLKEEEKLPEKDRTWFLVKSLRNSDWWFVGDQLKGFKEGQAVAFEERYKQIERILSSCLVGSENFGIPTEGISPKDHAAQTIAAMKETWKDEVASFVIRISFMSEQDAIKLSAPSA